MQEELRTESFRVIYEANYSRILGYTLRRTTSPEDAADVVSETFLVAWRRLDDVPPGDECRLWLYGVARRILANHHRRETRDRHTQKILAGDYRELLWCDPLPADLGPLSLAWSRLRPDEQDLLGLLIWEALSIEQIARVIGHSRSVAKLRIHRARKRFAQELARAGIELKPLGAGRHVEIGRACVRPRKEEET